MTPNQPGGGDGEKRACFRIEIWFVNYRGPHTPETLGSPLKFCLRQEGGHDVAFDTWCHAVVSCRCRC